MEGWSIQLGAMGHAMLSSEFHDEHGHGTEMAVAAHQLAPDAKLIAVKIMGKKLRTSAELMGAGIETSARNGAQVINLSLGTPNMAKPFVFGNVWQMPSNLGLLFWPPRILEETEPIRQTSQKRLAWRHIVKHPWIRSSISILNDSPAAMGTRSTKFLTHGYSRLDDGERGCRRGPGIATAYLSGTSACLAEALDGKPNTDLIQGSNVTL